MSAETPLPARLLNRSLEQLVRRGLRGVWVRGQLPPKATVWAANHHSWWDGFVAGAVLGRRGRSAALLMDGDNLDRFHFLATLGVIPTGRPRQALQALRQDRVLVIFPERELRGPGRLGPLAPGAEWFARQGPAALVPVAVRIANRGHQYPEAYVDIADPVQPDELADELSHLLERLDTELVAADPRQPLSGFDLVVTGRRSWDERIQRWSPGARS